MAEPSDTTVDSGDDHSPVSRTSSPSNQRAGTSEANPVSEASHLLQPRGSSESERLQPIEAAPSIDDDWLSDEDVQVPVEEESKNIWYLFLLTLSMGGLQIAWSVETSNFSPYLLSLGISKSFLAVIWVAGPLSGVLVQPYVGIKSDQCRSRLGKRRPFMIGGAIATSASLMILAWTKEIVVSILHGIFGAAADGTGVKGTTIAVAIIVVYVLDFSINVIQAAIRAFIVDNAPAHQQDSANAWASRASGVGNIIGYLFGYSDLPKTLWFFGGTQFKVLCVIASLAMIITVIISSITISERNPQLGESPVKQQKGLLKLFSHLYLAVRKLPKQIRSVCIVQFFAWIGWFPFLFYITTYIGEIYVEPIFSARPDMSSNEIDEVWQQATRIGTRALFVFAITSFTASVLLPFIVARSRDPPDYLVKKKVADSPSEAHSDGASNGLRGKFRRYGVVDRITHLTSAFPSLHMQWLTLRRAWLISHIMFAMLMFLTFLVRSTVAGTILVSLIGIPWAMTNWAPFALIATEIRERDRARRGLVASPHADEDVHLDLDEGQGEGTDQAGIVLGIHNVAVSAPQIIATLVSSVIFRALQKPRGSVGDDSVAWVLRFGGVAALIAALCSRMVAEEAAR